MIFTSKDIRVVKNRVSEMKKYKEFRATRENWSSAEIERVTYAHSMFHSLDPFDYQCTMDNKLCELAQCIQTIKDMFGSGFLS